MKQTDWKIIYTDYSGITKRAINFLFKELSAYVLREAGVYKPYTMPCEKEGAPLFKNNVFISLYNKSKTIQSLVKEEEVPKKGYFVKVMKNPNDESGSYIILTAHEEAQLYYAVASLFDDYVPKYAPKYYSFLMPDCTFNHPLLEASYSNEPDNETRSIFTWGHSTNDYRLYIENMARLRLNEVVIWNEYIPLNMPDLIEYAHQFGIRVILGYSWGWREVGNHTNEITEKNIQDTKELAISRYINEYKDVGADGIYFQTFTERNEEMVGGKLISEIVTDMVNEIAEKLWEITPDLRIIFGLHATSVKNHLDKIANLHKNIEILWEDCGEFPYDYYPFMRFDAFKETLEFTDKLLKLRDGAKVGLVFKGVMMLDWGNFAHQQGPYLIGENHPKVAKHDRQVRANAWRELSSQWLKNGNYVLETLKFIKKNKLGAINMCLAGTLDGGIYLPVALCAEMFYNCDDDFGNVLKKVSTRASIDYD